MVNNFIFSEPINDVICKRKSIRTYRNEVVSEGIVDKLNKYISSIKGPFEEKVEFKILDSNEYISGAKLGTYGVIKGAKKYIAVKVKKGKYDLEELGYEMESLVLYATSLNLGTCWIGGTFRKGEFAKAMELQDDEILPIVSPIGYEAAKRSFIEKSMRKLVKCDKRKKWNEIFYFRDFSCPLTEYCTLDGFKDCLENLRLAPSAVNKQPWRIVKCSDKFHFFISRDKEKSENDKIDMQRIDMGIAMCHFDLTCKDYGLKGGFKVIDHSIKDLPKNTEYVVSWVKEQKW